MSDLLNNYEQEPERYMLQCRACSYDAKRVDK